MDIAEEIRVWGARQSDSSYWGQNAYKQFAETLEYGTVELNGSPIEVVSRTEVDYEYEGPLQLVFRWDDRLFALDGSHSSWDGTSWDGAPYEVEEQPVTKVEYVRKR